MSFSEKKQVNVIQLMGGAFSEFGAIGKEVAIYFVGFAAIMFLPIYTVEFGWIFMLLAFLLYFPAQYYLYRTMLAKAGMLKDDGWRVIEFFVMALVLIIPISIGFNIFWIPGLILVAKWLMAPTYLVAGERNLFEAIGDGWRASDGNTLNLTIAVVLMGVVWTIAAVPLVLFWTAANAGQSVMVSMLLWMHIAPVLLAGLSVSAYRQLSDDTAKLSEVFA